MTTETKTTPTPTEIDTLCEIFDAAKMEADLAGQDLSTVKGKLLVIVQSFGYTPTHAEKTTRLEGILIKAFHSEMKRVTNHFELMEHALELRALAHTPRKAVQK